MRIPASVYDAINRELEITAVRALPMDPLRRAALVAEEAGEALKCALDLTRASLPPGKVAPVRADLRLELVQTATMAVRVLSAMDEEDRGNE
jgi:hypothetical protein